MKPKSLEFSPALVESKAVLSPGYTIARIKKFSPHERINIRNNVQSYDILRVEGTQLDQERISSGDEHVIKVETIALSSIFISQIWKMIHEWVTAHPPGILYEEKDADERILQPPSQADLKQMFKGRTSIEVANEISQNTRGIFLNLTKQWVTSQKIKLLAPEPQDGEERKIYRTFKRYRTILSFGMNSVRSPIGAPASDPATHILGGFGTSRYIISQLLGNLPEVYTKQYGHPPSKAELLSLTQSTKNLVLSVAMVDIQTLVQLQKFLQENSSTTPGYGSLKADTNFDPDRFLIIKKGDDLYLEIKPDVLDEINQGLIDSGNDILRTGCPAMFAEGTEGKNVVSEMYDWFAKLYEEFYINQQPE